MAADAYLLRCSVCGEVVDERRQTVYNKVTGWEKKRDQGGTNALRLREPDNEFMCVICMDKLTRGLSAGQMDLYGSGA